MTRSRDDYSITLFTKSPAGTMSVSRWDSRVKAFLNMTPEEQAAFLDRGRATKTDDKPVVRDE